MGQIIAVCLAVLFLASACNEVEHSPLTEFDRSLIPSPVLDDRPELVQLYWLAWEQAWQHVHFAEAVPRSPFMDEAAQNGRIWIWDTSFMVLFTKYAWKTFPGVESLENFYQIIHDGASSSQAIEHPDNPPLFAWAEWESYQLSGDLARLGWLIRDRKYLQKHFEWFNSKRFDGRGYRWSGNPSGMDNTPRGRSSGGYDEIYWFDAMAQQALSARLIAKMAREIGDDATVSAFNQKFAALKKTLNEEYWDEEEGFYVDLNRHHPKAKDPVRTPATYWPMMAGVAEPGQAERLKKAAMDPELFGGAAPFPSLVPSDPDFDPTGRYWKGGIWIPLAYMSIKALEEYGFLEEADRLAARVIDYQLATYAHVEPHTIWEAYSPTEFSWATNADGESRCRPDFSGWSALGPISLLIENYLGLHRIDARKRVVEWRVHQHGRHGIKNLRFGDVITDLVSEKNEIRVESNSAYLLRVNGQEFQIHRGEQILQIRNSL